MKERVVSRELPPKANRPRAVGASGLIAPGVVALGLVVPAVGNAHSLRRRDSSSLRDARRRLQERTHLPCIALERAAMLRGDAAGGRAGAQ
jgi:hypothetical protein